MSNIVTHRDLIHCTAAAIALSTAFVVVTMPKPDAAAASTADNDAKAACMQTCCFQTCCFQTWPYYERSCLHDDRQRDGNGRTVRVIAINGQAWHQQAPHHVSRQ